MRSSGATMEDQFRTQRSVPEPLMRRTLSADYVVLHRLGGGSNGEVLLAVCRETGIRYAVKRFKSSGDEISPSVRRELRVLRSAAGVAVPGLLRQAVDRDGIYFVSTLAEFGDLGRRLRLAGGLPLAELLRVACQATDGLIGLHSAGFLHNDLKPGNLLWAADDGRRGGDCGVILLSDFGSATRIGEKPGKEFTAMYAAPERSEQVSGLTDQYSLGASLLQLVTDCRPFSVGAALRVLHECALGEVLRRMVSNRAEDRFADLGQVRGAFRSLYDGLQSSEFVVPRPHEDLVLTAADMPPAQRLWHDFLGLALPWTDQHGTRFRCVPAGGFRLGQTETLETLRACGLETGDADWVRQLLQEGPPRDVRIVTSFLMADAAVTVRQFAEFVRRTGYCVTARRGIRRWLSGVGGVAGDESLELSGEHPVVNVSWYDARAFIDWLNQTAEQVCGRAIRYRLPTEWEWEYCCRAGTETRFFSGDSLSDLQVVTRSVAGSGVFPIRSFGANWLGIHDLTDNVCEWCDNWYDAELHRVPDLHRAQSSGVFRDGCRAVRGGSWHSPKMYQRSASRSGMRPSEWNSWTGFRLVCDVPDLLRDPRGHQR